MATSAAIGYGIAFAILAGAVYTDLGEVADAKRPPLTRETVDVTHHKSPARTRELIAGLRKSGEATVTLNYLPNGQSWLLLKAAFDSDTPATFRITLPGGATAIFSAFVTELSEETPLADKMSLSVKLEITGVVAWA